MHWNRVADGLPAGPRRRDEHHDRLFLVAGEHGALIYDGLAAWRPGRDAEPGHFVPATGGLGFPAPEDIVLWIEVTPRPAAPAAPRPAAGTLDETEKILLGVIDGPVHPEACGHGGYIASFEHLASPRRVERIDLYAYEGHGRQEFCLRYGPGPGDYRSPGGYENLVRLQGDPYRQAAGILQGLGRVAWTPKAGAPARTCKTCRWWQNGECEVVDMEPAEIEATRFAVAVRVADDHGLNTRVLTGPDFGCVLHEPGGG